MSAETEVHVLALDGIPEIRDGDDLGVFIANAIQRTRGALPLTIDDVIVVTQKIVSKAEGMLEAVDPDDPLSHKKIVERESVRVLRRRGSASRLRLVVRPHGRACPNSGEHPRYLGRSPMPDGKLAAPLRLKSLRARCRA